VNEGNQKLFYQLRIKLTKTHAGKQNYNKVPTGEKSNENKINKYVEGKGKKKKKEGKNRYAKLNRGR